MAKVPKDTLTFKQMRLSRLHNGDSIYLNAAPCRDDKVLTNTRVDGRTIRSPRQPGGLPWASAYSIAFFLKATVNCRRLPLILKQNVKKQPECDGEGGCLLHLPIVARLP